jgi:hypothetical protein
MIQEKKLNGLDNEPIKTTKKQPPITKNKYLPSCWFTSIFIGSKGSGKTYSLVKLLKLYEKFPFYDYQGNKLSNRIIIFCPTFHSSSNPIYETLKNLDEEDICLNYSDEELMNKIKDIENENELIKEYGEY